MLNRQVNPEVLDTYNLERRADGKILMAQCKANDALMYMNVRLKSMVLYIAKHYLPFMTDYSVKQAAKLNFQYPKSKITVESKTASLKWFSTLWWYKMIFGCNWEQFAYRHKVSVGQRLPPHLLETEVHLGKAQAGFKAVVFSKNNDFRIKIAKRIADDFDLVEKVYVADNLLYARCGVDDECLMIVRPDGHVGFRSESCVLDLVSEYFEGFAFENVKCNL